ncbi:MAG TPA: hypothetical protein DEP35_25075 [Deltaproteobacteria bacterium]|nr:hypothetical protein [Deltaproteobacteria bacterium]
MHTERSGFSVAALARELRTSKSTIAAEIRSGRLRAARIGKRRYLILAKDVEAWAFPSPPRELGRQPTLPSLPSIGGSDGTQGP